jgi:hypothetical protein
LRQKTRNWTIISWKPLFSELLLEGRKTIHIKMNLMMSFSLTGIPDVLAYMHYIGEVTFFDAVCREHLF